MLKGPFNVSFDLQKGTGETPSFNVFEGEIPLPKIDDPVKEHYEFIGYGLEKVAKEEDFIKKYFIVAEKDVIIYAQWNQVDFKVTYDSNGGIGDQVIDWVVKDPDTKKGTLKLPSNPGFTKLHYDFNGWLVGGVEYKAGETLEISEDTEIKVNWKLVDCMIHVVCDYEDVEWTEQIMYCLPQASFPAPNFPKDWSFDENIYGFIGWKDETGAEYTPGQLIPVGSKQEKTLTLFLGKLRKFVRTQTNPSSKAAYVFFPNRKCGLKQGSIYAGYSPMFGKINYKWIGGYVPYYFTERQIKSWSLDEIILVDDGKLSLATMTQWYRHGYPALSPDACMIVNDNLDNAGSPVCANSDDAYLPLTEFPVSPGFRNFGSYWALCGSALKSGEVKATSALSRSYGSQTVCIWYDLGSYSSRVEEIWAYEEVTE